MADKNNKVEENNKYWRLQDEERIMSGYFPSDRTKFKWLCVILIVAASALTILVMSPSISTLVNSSKTDEAALHQIYLQQLKTFRQEALNASEENSPPVVSCYYNLPSEHGINQLMPSDINPFLCTHINVAFARVLDKQIKLENYQYRVLLDIVKLKQKNPFLKILLSVGGAGNDNGFSDMVIDHTSRKIFIKSIKNMLRNYTLDGIDLDWEFPALHKAEVGGRERQHFSQLLREIQKEYVREKRNYYLTVAVAAPQAIVDISYDVDQLNQYVDYVNIMTYDFHYYTKYTPFTGFNSPLYPRHSEQLYFATLNINYTVNMYMNKGLDPTKIVVGIPTYGHTFTLFNANNHEINSPASGFGSLGSLGFINYPEVCAFLKDFKSNVTVKQDEEAKVPYLYRNKEWVSYDTPQSVMEKAKFIKEKKLRGAMIYSLNADDYAGICDSELGGITKFPLSLSVRKALFIVL